MSLNQLELFGTPLEKAVECKSHSVAKRIFDKYIECFQSPQNFLEIATKKGKTQGSEEKYKQHVPAILNATGLPWSEATSQDKCDYRISVNNSVLSEDDASFIEERNNMYKANYKEIDLKNSMLGLEFKKSKGAFCLNDTLPHEDVMYMMIRPLRRSGTITLWNGKDVLTAIREKWERNFNNGDSELLLDDYVDLVDWVNRLSGKSARTRPNHMVSNGELRKITSPLRDYRLEWDKHNNITSKTII
jgi:hypothetical protein